jgi:hypothetical protein
LDMDLFQNVLGLAGRHRLGPFARPAARNLVPACSSVAVWGDSSQDGTLLHGRNFDFPGMDVWNRHQSVVFCEPDEGLKYGYVAAFATDLPGITSFNEAGLSLTVHTRFHRDVRFDGAAVVDLCHDIIRRAETIKDAVKIANERPVASAWGLMVSSAGERRAVVLETTGREVALLEPVSGSSSIGCANQHRHPRLSGGQVAPMSAWVEHSDAREKRLRQVVNESSTRGGMSVSDVAGLLGDTVDPYDQTNRPGGGILAQAISVKSIVAEPEKQCIHVSVGDVPTGWGPYLTVPWSWDGAVGVVDIDLETLPLEEASKPPAAGYTHFLAASRMHMDTHDLNAVAGALDLAVEADPDEPVYRFLRGLIALRDGKFAEGSAHLDHALAHEESPFRRAQQLLWSSRAAAILKESDKAALLRSELLGMRHPNIGEYQAAAEREQERPYPKRKFKRLVINLSLVDAL